ncbi:hypothetical protein Btru_063899 [Bulinus truncatus]|nr:hypothetical protein Btru_063899 [Bulinus truncatus]
MTAVYTVSVAQGSTRPRSPALMMGSKGYEPVPRHKDERRRDDTADGEVETHCGILSARPDFMQPCANICCFTVFYSIAALLTSTLTVYVSSQVTTLERQFGFTAKQTGLIMAANDIGFLVCVLFISYSSAKLHIPKSLGIATITFGVSGLSCALPHFIFGARADPEAGRAGASNDTRERSSLFGALCDNSTPSSCDPELHNAASSWVSTHVSTVSLVIIVIGMMLQGFGKAPRVSLVVTYVDNNTKRTNTGLFMGIIVTLGILGPAVAYTMGGIFTRMYVTLEATTLTPKHPRWIGAWWLGYVVFGVLSLFISIPLFWFPRKLPQRQEQNGGVESSNGSSQQLPLDHLREFTKPGQGVSQTNNDTVKVSLSETSRDGELRPPDQIKLKSFGHEVKGFLAVLGRLWTNPIYTCCLISSCFLIFAVSAGTSNTVKYMERMFNLPTHRANYVMAGKSLFASCIGTFVGGYLTKRLKMTAFKALLFITVAVASSLAFTIAAMFFQCEQPTVHNWPGSPEACNSGCNCEEDSYFAVCGQDGTTYYSPCTAGCASLVNEVYYNCSCIAGGMGTAVAGACDYGCDNLIAYAIFSALVSLTGTLGIVPKIILIIRCVEDRDKGFAMGLQAFMTSFFGWLLAPIVFGYVIDGICTIWDVQCGTSGRCLLYDNELFRVKLHGYCATALACSLVVLIIACAYARCTGCLDDKGQRPPQRSTTSAAASHAATNSPPILSVNS